MAADDPLLCVGDVLHLAKADWVYGDRDLTVRVSDIRYGIDKPDCLVIAILGTVMEFGRDGRMLMLNVYKSALSRPGVREHRRAVNGVDPPLETP
ncbi:hypothetical protein O7623_12735 [Solwaraspora sp. WMMD791]|uniref:hypothetical protein n=1 Tax=Solwaraspora sp. WMMD791 TaxID=3016086 RepID=UPI00249BE217|nr:hypothetical protein [Solwaraspora sp. WMMD791]WFE29993.1 hypothetical protein O7623_12735 [Solwaraspora sp. WMMD791]